MPFGPGDPRINRKGRPSVGQSLADAVRRKYPPEKIIELAEKHLASDDEKVAFAAVTFLADRGYGKAKETVEIQTELTPEEYAEELAIVAREHIASLSDEERERLLAQDPAPSDMIQ